MRTKLTLAIALGAATAAHDFLASNFFHVYRASPRVPVRTGAPPRR